MNIMWGTPTCQNTFGVRGLENLSREILSHDFLPGGGEMLAILCLGAISPGPWQGKRAEESPVYMQSFI